MSVEGGVATFKMSTFISNHFTIRQCRRFVEDEAKFSKLCQCGRSHEWHIEQGITSSDKRRSKPLTMDHEITNVVKDRWNSNMDTLQKVNSRYFGRLKFDDQNYPLACPNFIRLEGRLSNEYMRKVSWLLLSPECWHLPEPGFIVDVIGKPMQWKYDFKETLMKQFHEIASKGNNSELKMWMIFDGSWMNIVNRSIGKVVNCNNLIPIAVTPWFARLRQAVDDAIERNNGQIPVDPIYFKPKHENDLSRNCQNFLFVDDGSELDLEQIANNTLKYVMKFRAKMVSKIVDTTKPASNASSSSSNVATSSLGGIHDLQTITTPESSLEAQANLYNRIPCLIALFGGDLNDLDYIKSVLHTTDDESSSTITLRKPSPIVLFTQCGGLAELMAYCLDLPQPRFFIGSNVKMTKKMAEEAHNEKTALEMKVKTHFIFKSLLESAPRSERQQTEANVLNFLLQLHSFKRYVSHFFLSSSFH